MSVPKRDLLNRVRETWMGHAPHLWWGDGVDVRFLIADTVRSLSGIRALDVGCGAGVLLSEVPPTNVSVGVEMDPEAARLARKLNPRATVVMADMLALPFQESSFDLVIFCGMLEVPPPGRKGEAIREVGRVLRRGGQMFLTTLNRRYPGSRRSSFTVTYENLQDLLLPQFDAKIKGFNPFPPFPYFLPNRLLTRVPGVWHVLVRMMERGIGTRWSCAFFVKAVKR